MILWLNALPTKDSPKIIQSFHLNDVVHSTVTPKIIGAEKKLKKYSESIENRIL